MTGYWFYVYSVLSYFLFPFLYVASFFSKKLKASRKGQAAIWRKLEDFNDKRLPLKKVIWLHAASAGEFEQLRPLITRLSSRDYHLVQTVTSATIYRGIAGDSRFDCLCYLPWDLPTRTKRFISKLKPDIFINTRHDLWFNLLRSLNRAKIPSVLINANLYQNSARLKWWSRSFQKELFGQISRIFTVSDSVAKLLKQLYSGEIIVSGDTRFDQVYERAQINNKEFLPESVHVSGRKVIVYGSVIPSDVDVVTSAVIRADNDKLLHLLVPHEIGETDLQLWEEIFQDAGVASIRKDRLNEWAGEPIIIWNAVGELADLYKVAQLAYVGAGFSTGVHNVIEPAVYGIPVAYGPRYDILAEAIEMAKQKIAAVIQTNEDLLQFFQLPENAEKYETVCRQTREYVQAGIGAADKIFECITGKTHKHKIE